MEGITDSIYRRLHHQYFGGIDRYYMPFLSPTMHRTLTHREERELPLADSVSFEAVPQILTKVAEDFLWAANVCADRGYKEVNLNVGCPSGTVVAKGKGSGMLRDLSHLDGFLDAIFTASPLPISLKTRLGMESAEEFPAILEIYNRYPIRELTIHPRFRKQFYSGGVDMDAFRYACQNSKNPLCYNGDLISRADIADFSTEFPQIEAVMIGRGLLADPALARRIRGGKEAGKDELRNWYTALYEGWKDRFDRTIALGRIKKLMEWPAEGHIEVRRRLRRAGDIESCISAVLWE
jgi:tRNA-dihydrouridine synthase